MSQYNNNHIYKKAHFRMGIWLISEWVSVFRYGFPFSPFLGLVGFALGGSGFFNPFFAVKFTGIFQLCPVAFFFACLQPCIVPVVYIFIQLSGFKNLKWYSFVYTTRSICSSFFCEILYIDVRQLCHLCNLLKFIYRFLSLYIQYKKKELLT